MGLPVELIPKPASSSTAPKAQAARPAARHAASTSTSNGKKKVGSRGISLILAEEKFQPELYQPTKGSGVTLGYGYDMKARNSQSVLNDLVAVGVDRKQAERVAAGAGLKGSTAKTFVEKNRNALHLTDEEARSLFARSLTAYEQTVRTGITVPLTQNQYDALVSLSYNIGVSGFRHSSVRKYLNRGDYDAAAKAFMLYTRSGGAAQPGLVARRKQEALLFQSR
jgi:GH24 family phage-related lysozyme (muramidase)